MTDRAPPRIIVLGAGFIGTSFAAAFVDSGAQVTLVEPDPVRRDTAEAAIAAQTAAIRLAGLALGRAGNLSLLEDAGSAYGNAELVIECGPENLDVKQQIFAELLAKTLSSTVLATASSAITMSQILPDEAAQSRCLVAHPVNPPAILRLIELVPAPGTASRVLDAASKLFSTLGFEAVVLRHEVEGFILNRLQGAVLREAYRLVSEGITSVNDIDTVMRLGLGPRWALAGPFETAELNTPGGIKAHAARMGPAYKRIGEGRGETVEWTDELVAQVESQRRQILPEASLPTRADWRAIAIARLVAARDQISRDSND
ncbi:MAG: L-gulonate 3-dehydrogenase [Sulfitobacter sp.]|jgi:3-hydroxyacyl-CoA dehydrogenase